MKALGLATARASDAARPRITTDRARVMRILDGSEVEEQRVERAIVWTRVAAALIVVTLGPRFANVGLPAVYLLGLAILAYGLPLGRLLLSARSPSSRARTVRIAFVGDALAVSIAMVVFAPDPGWTTYAYGSLLVIAGAFRLGRGGAYVSAIFIGAAYVGVDVMRQIAYGYPLEPPRIAVNVSAYLLVALLMTQILAELHALRRRQTDLYEPLLRAQGELGEALALLEDGRPVFWNDAFERATGCSADGIRALPSVLDVIAERQRPAFAELLSAGALQSAAAETVFARSEGREAEIEVALEPFVVGGRALVLLAGRDITARKRAQRALERRALYDSVTGLPNRTLFRDRVRQTVRASRRKTAPVSVIALDLDGLRDVSETFGHRAGDALLSELARRCTHLLRETDTVARLADGELAVLLPGASEDAAIRVARQLGAEITRPAAFEGTQLGIGASVGVTTCEGSCPDGDTLIRQAMAALAVAKRTRVSPAVYASGSEAEQRQALALGGELHEALARGAIGVAFQPITRVDDGRVIAMEALARWDHPERGNVPPDLFIRVAEQTGAIRPLFARVLRLALDERARWAGRGHDLAVNVNLSVRNLHDPELIPLVGAALAATATSPDRLVLEVTESVVMDGTEDAARSLQRLRDLGVRIAIDDFGTGYASLQQLLRVPATSLKIDRGFIRDMLRDARSMTITRSVIDLARDLGLDTVAEGVEDAETLRALERIGCGGAQGYAIARPMGPREAEVWLEGRTGQSALHLSASDTAAVVPVAAIAG